MEILSSHKRKVKAYSNLIAPQRDLYIKRNWLYYNDLIRFLRFSILENSTIIEIGCGTGYILSKLNPKLGVGIDISDEMVKIATMKYPQLRFYQMDAENITINKKFDYIIISETLGYFEDIQKVFKEINKLCHINSKIIITYHNFLWQPFLKVAEYFRLKMPQQRLNWLNKNDIDNLLMLEGFDIINNGKRFLFPKYIPILSFFFNRYLVHFPFFRLFGITGHTVAMPLIKNKLDKPVSIIVPARNEKGNIEEIVKRIPKIGSHVEIIFIEGRSNDGTLEEIISVYEKYRDKYDIKYAVQDNKGKGDAVRKGFDLATGDILMILDADMTVRPEDLTKFYNAIVENKGEMIIGSRLIYPMEKQAMRLLNMFGNKFFSILFTWLLGQRIKDTLCGTKVLSKYNWEKIKANRSYFGDFDPFGDFDLIFGSAKLNLKIIEIPIRYQARTYGSTNISRFTHGWLLLKMVLFAMNKIKFI